MYPFRIAQPCVCVARVGVVVHRMLRESLGARLILVHPEKFYELVSSRFSVECLHPFRSPILRVVNGNFAYRLITTIKERHLSQFMEKRHFWPGDTCVCAPEPETPHFVPVYYRPSNILTKSKEDCFLAISLSMRVRSFTLNLSETM